MQFEYSLEGHTMITGWEWKGCQISGCLEILKNIQPDLAVQQIKDDVSEIKSINGDSWMGIWSSQSCTTRASLKQ